MDGIVDWSLIAPAAEQGAPMYTAHQVGMGALILAIGLMLLLAISEAVKPSLG